MAAGRNLFGLSAQAKARLVEKLSSAAMRIAPQPGRARVLGRETRRGGRPARRVAVRGASRYPHDRGGGGFPRHRRSVFPSAPGNRRRRDDDRRPPLHRISPRTITSGSTATRESPRRRRRRSTATALRCRRAAWCPANGRSTASWSRRWPAFTAPRTPRAGRRPCDERHGDRPSARPQRPDRARFADPQQHHAGRDPVGRAAGAVPPPRPEAADKALADTRARHGTRCSSSRAITAWTATCPTCRLCRGRADGTAPG